MAPLAAEAKLLERQTRPTDTSTQSWAGASVYRLDVAIFDFESSFLSRDRFKIDLKVKLQTTGGFDEDGDEVSVEIRWQTSRFENYARLVERLKSNPWVVSACLSDQTLSQKLADPGGIFECESIIDLDRFAEDALKEQYVSGPVNIYGGPKHALYRLAKWFKGKTAVSMRCRYVHVTIDSETYWINPTVRWSVTERRLRKYDAFISHAWDDKAVVKPLADLLIKKGFRIWYDEFELKVGDSLIETIDKGLLNSRYGIVFLSPKFFAKPWPKRELTGLTTLQLRNGRPMILPVWYDVGAAEIAAVNPSLADTVGVRCDSSNLEQVAMRLAEVLRGGESTT